MPLTINHEAATQRAAGLIRDADALLITAGAGMGVDSGLPDFRGPNGFWGVYPALGRAKLHFEDIANPQAFLERPNLAWGFYGHRLNLYRGTAPGKNFEILQRMAEDMPYGAFAFTSNVDGHFQRAGFTANRICEVHGSIHHLQCLSRCSDHIWSAHNFKPAIDAENCQITSEMPYCPHCGGLARPNILMFGDWNWVAARQTAQLDALNNWLAAVKNLVVIELGAGTAIPTVRHFGENQGAPLIRINKTESFVSRESDIALPFGGLEALQEIASFL
jgi:NAD-dependent SIR2 family protein deacetylase